VQTAPVQSGLFFSGGSPYAFTDGGDINGNPVVTGALPTASGGAALLTPTRFPYPGEAGSRNNFRGQGFFGIDTGLAKSWPIHESMSLKFAWEVFNATNSVRFNDNTNTSLDVGSDNGASFGLYSATLTVSRVQQFSLRFSF